MDSSEKSLTEKILYRSFIGKGSTAYPGTCDSCKQEDDINVEGVCYNCFLAQDDHLICSWATAERVLGIPIGTLEGNNSAVGQAIKKIVMVFPWILELAEEGFDPAKKKEILLREAMKPENKLKLQAMSRANIQLDE